MMRNCIAVALLLLLSISGVASESEKDIFEVETEGTYQFTAGSSPDLAKAVALFNAKRNAVELAGRYLSRLAADGDPQQDSRPFSRARQAAIDRRQRHAAAD